MESLIVERLHKEFLEIIDQIDQRETSLRITAEETFRKSLLLTAASYFETRIIASLEQLVAETAPNNHLLQAFVRNKAIARQYHTYFQWDKNNANAFFGLFGEAFKSYMLMRLKQDTQLDAAIKAFLELGRERNRLVHQNYGTFALTKTAEEIFQLYLTAHPFVEGLNDLMRTYLETVQQELFEDE